MHEPSARIDRQALQTALMTRRRTEEQFEKFAALVLAGSSTATAAKAVGVANSTGFKWAQSLRPRRVAKKKADTLRFARLVPQGSATGPIYLALGDVTIKVQAVFEDEALARVIRVVRGAQ